MHNDDSLTLIPTEKLRVAMGPLPCDVYIKLSDRKFTRVFLKSQNVDQRRLVNYLQKSTVEFYINSNLIEIFNIYASSDPIKLLESIHSSDESKSAALASLTQRCLSEPLETGTLTAETIDSAKYVVKNYIHNFTQSPTSFKAVLKLLESGDQTIHHSMKVSFMSYLIGKEMRAYNEQTLEEISLGAFLHDLGCGQHPSEITRGLEHWNIRHNHRPHHVDAGVAMAKKVRGLSPHVLRIIELHHDPVYQRSGAPAPENLVGTIDSFCALTSAVDHRTPFTPQHAIALLSSRPKQFHPEVIDVLQKIFLEAIDDRESA